MIEIDQAHMGLDVVVEALGLVERIRLSARELLGREELLPFYMALAGQVASFRVRFGRRPEPGAFQFELVDEGDLLAVARATRRRETLLVSLAPGRAFSVLGEDKTVLLATMVALLAHLGLRNGRLSYSDKSKVAVGIRAASESRENFGFSIFGGELRELEVFVAPDGAKELLFVQGPLQVVDRIVARVQSGGDFCPVNFPFLPDRGEWEPLRRRIEFLVFEALHEMKPELRVYGWLPVTRCAS